jgi:ABC-type multidrug transport system fused ATPase/permease subunit
MVSGGEKQRVAIARSIIKRPDILIFDEATSALDSHTEEEIRRSILEVSKGVTSITVAHRFATVIDSDEIILLVNGEIKERGTHDQLFRMGGRYFALYTKQSGLESNRFLNPGERVPDESEDDTSTRPPRPQEVEESTRNLLGF